VIGVNEAQAVVERLERIAALEQAGAARPVLMEELRSLLADASTWSPPQEAGDGARKEGAAETRKKTGKR
jgi:hypothetical protein